MSSAVLGLRRATPRRLTPVLVLVGLSAALAASVLVGLFCGAVALTPAQVGMALMAWLSGSEPADPMLAVISVIRLPRLLLAALVGGVLAVSGAAMQGLFRNPLADPGLIGVSSGAGLGAVSVIVLGNWLRSEEHTSELQSRGHLVCRLLLEKKKK